MFYILFFICCFIFFIVPVTYYYYMYHVSKKDWNILINEPKELPSISIIIPSYNEEELIEYKLNNVINIDYPKKLMKIIIIDSASTDSTSIKIEKFLKSHSDYDILFISEKIRNGKSNALNRALERTASDLIVVSDSDCFLPSNIIKDTLPYLSDPRVAALAAEEKILNNDQSGVINREIIYRKRMSTIRYGESKLYSTIRFEGGFAIYKKKYLSKFDTETGADDSGTALNIVQNGGKTLLLPTVNFYTFFPTSLKGKITIKYRRANHLLKLWIKILKLLLNGKLILPKRIAIPNLFMHIVNPIIFLIMIVIYLYWTILNPLLLLVFIPITVIPMIKDYSIEITINNVILFFALFGLLMNKNFIMWNKTADSRNNINPELLKQYGLIQF